MNIINESPSRFSPQCSTRVINNNDTTDKWIIQKIISSQGEFLVLIRGTTNV